MKHLLTHHRWNDFTKIRYGFYLLFFIYFISSQILLPAKSITEVFPFFDWSLFSYAEPFMRVYQVRIKLEDPLQQECLLQTCSFINKDFLNQRTFALIQQVGHTYSESSQTRNSLEDIEILLRHQIPQAFEYSLIESDVFMPDYRRSLKTLNDKIIFQSGIIR